MKLTRYFRLVVAVLPMCLAAFSPLSTCAGTTTPEWKVRVDSVGKSFPYDNLTDIVKDGVARVPQSALSLHGLTLTDYWSGYSLPLSPLFSGDAARLEARIKNSAADGNLWSYDLCLSFAVSDISGTAPAPGGCFVGASSGVPYSSLSNGLSSPSQSGMFVDMQDWHVFAVETKNNSVIAYYDGKEVAHIAYAGSFGLVNELRIGTKSRGIIDWVKLYQSNQLVVEENFDVNAKSNVHVYNNCAPTLSSNAINATAMGGNFSVNITTNTSSCTWSAVSNVSWLHLNSSSGTGSGTTGFSVDANNSIGSRSGIVTIEGRDFTVTQEGVSAGQAATISSADCLFNWAEKNYSQYFAPAAMSKNLDVYYYRQYTGTNSIFGISSDKQRVLYIGPLTDGSLLDLGEFPTWLATAGCKH